MKVKGPSCRNIYYTITYKTQTKVVQTRFYFLFTYTVKINNVSLGYIRQLRKNIFYKD